MQLLNEKLLTPNLEVFRIVGSFVQVFWIEDSYLLPIVLPLPPQSKLDLSLQIIPSNTFSVHTWILPAEGLLNAGLIN